MKLNESEGYDEASLTRKTESKPDSYFPNWDKSDGNLITGQMAAGVEAPRAWHRLL